MLRQYVAAPEHSELAERTRRDYRSYIEIILETLRLDIVNKALAVFQPRRWCPLDHRDPECDDVLSFIESLKGDIVEVPERKPLQST